MSQALKYISEQNKDLCLNTYNLVMANIYIYIYTHNKLGDENYEKVQVKGEWDGR